MTQFENCRPVEVRGQVRGVRMNPPGEGGGGTFQLLLEDGATIVQPLPGGVARRGRRRVAGQ